MKIFILDVHLDKEILWKNICLPSDIKMNVNKKVSITKYFKIINAKSRSIDVYDEGSIAFVSNGFMNKGIIKYVTPYEDDKVFMSPCITISAFCEAIVQNEPFVARGNGGSGLSILEPKFEMPSELLLEYASYINEYCSWKFCYGRMVTIERLKKIKIPMIDV